MLRESPSWWNGSEADLDRLSLAYHFLARVVCQAKSYTPKEAQLPDSGFPPLDLLLDQAS